jgi:hypothetical protein
MGMYGNTMLGQAAAMSPVGMYSLGQTGNIFQPESQYNAQLITANRQEAMQAQMANAQSRAGLTSGILGAVGTIGGAMLGGPMGAALGGSLMGGLGGGGGAATPQLGASFMNRVGGGMGDYTLGGTYHGNYSD